MGVIRPDWVIWGRHTEGVRGCSREVCNRNWARHRAERRYNNKRDAMQRRKSASHEARQAQAGVKCSPVPRNFAISLYICFLGCRVGWGKVVYGFLCLRYIRISTKAASTPVNALNNCSCPLSTAAWVSATATLGSSNRQLSSIAVKRVSESPQPSPSRTPECTTSEWAKHPSPPEPSATRRDPVPAWTRD